MNWAEIERQRKTAAYRQQLRDDLQKRLDNSRWYLENSSDCTERTRQMWRDQIFEYEKQLKELA